VSTLPRVRNYTPSVRKPKNAASTAETSRVHHSVAQSRRHRPRRHHPQA
jgi:hypothetical protein